MDKRCIIGEYSQNVQFFFDFCVFSILFPVLRKVKKKKKKWVFTRNFAQLDNPKIIRYLYNFDGYSLSKDLKNCLTPLRLWQTSNMQGTVTSNLSIFVRCAYGPQANKVHGPHGTVLSTHQS